eukprot:jgi/Ulvmu1/2946/UM149_0029.1
MPNISSGSNGQQERDAYREKQERMEHFARQFNDDSEGLRLHHELCNPAVAEAASQCRVVWAQVKGYPYWPAQILLPKDAKIRFRDTAQEYSEKRMATHRPVHFFVTREISWVLSKQVKSWAQGVADGCHTKNRMNGTFRDSLLQVCDLLYGRKAPSGFAKPTQPATRQRSAPSPVRPARQPSASPTGAASAPQTHSPPQVRSVPRPRPHSSAEHFAEEVERSRNAILGGMSRDERHRRREESRATEVATQPSPSDTLSPPASMATQATATVNTHPPQQNRVVAIFPPACSSGGAEGASGGQGPGTPASSAAAQERDSGGENAPKRHTRSQGVAELGVSDLRNLEPRKIPRRGGPTVPHVTTSGMGSRGTGDGATGRPPPVETPQSVGTAPFADARSHSVSASLPAELGSRCPVGSPRSAQAGETPRDGLTVPNSGSARQAQSAGPVLSTPEVLPCLADVPCLPQPPYDDAAGGSDSVRNAADSSVARAYRGDAATGLGGMAACTSMHKSPMDLSVGPEPKASPPVVCQEGSYVNGPSPRSADPVQAPAQPSASIKLHEAEVACVVACDVPPVPAATNAMSSQEKHMPNSLAAAPGTDDAVLSAAQDIRRDFALQHDAGNVPVLRVALPLPKHDVRSPGGVDQPQPTVGADCSRSIAVVVSGENNKCGVVVQGQQPLRNGAALAATPRASPEGLVSLASQDEDMRDVGGSVNGEEDPGVEANNAEMAVKRPRRAARARKNAQELVNGEAARGIQAPQKSADRGGTRSADGGSRNTSSQRAGGSTPAAPPCRKSATAVAGAPELQAARRTRSANAPMSGGTVASPAEATGQRPLSQDAQLHMSVVLTAAAAAAQGDVSCSAHVTPHAVLEQLAVLQAQPQTEENLRYTNQLQAMLQSSQAQAVVDAAGVIRNAQAAAVAVGPTVAAPAQAPPIRPASMLPVAEAIQSIFSRDCDVTEMKEFWLPHEYLLMRTSQHQHSDVNKYPPELKPKRLRKDVQICSCTRREEYKNSDTYCCGDGCLNRSASILCDPRSCPCRGDCQNKPFNLRKHPSFEVTLTESRGKGLFAREAIQKGQFVVEYTGEVVNETERLARMVKARNNGVLHFYIMELSPGLYIDAAHVGSNARFMNSSCDPNCETQKWKDAATGETRIGLFTTRPVHADEELTYDYHFQHAGLQTAAQGFRCMCGSVNCRGTMDENPERMRDAGRRVRIKWDDDDKWYEGYVLRYHPNTRKHTIYYPVDGDAAGTQETLLLDAVEHEWMDDALTAQLPVTSATAAAPGQVARLPPQVPNVNPATGKPAGQAAVDATHERARWEEAQTVAAEQQAKVAAVECAQAVVSATQLALPAASVAPAMSAVPASAAAAAASDAQRVPLPRPLPMRPPERGAAPEPVSAMPAAPADGLELLSSVAASLPDRSHTPAIGPTGATDAAKVTTEGGAGTAAVATDNTAADAANPAQMPMFAVLALLQPRITDTSQLQRAPLPAAEHAAPAPQVPAPQVPAPQVPVHALEQQQIVQNLLSSSVVQQQALAVMAAAGAPAGPAVPDRVTQPQPQAQQPVVPASDAPGASHTMAIAMPTGQAAVSPVSPAQADTPTTLPQAVHAMRTISPSPASEAPQVLTQAAYPSSRQQHSTAGQGVGFPVMSQYQALQKMQASMHAQAHVPGQQQHHQPPAAQLQSAQQPQQQSSQAPQSPTLTHAQQHSATQQQAAQQQQAVQQAHMQQLLAAANWPQHTPATLAASMQAMLQQVVAGMQRGDANAALSMQQQQQMHRLVASLPVQAQAAQPDAAQPALRSAVPHALPSATATGGGHQHAAAATQRNPGASGAVPVQHLALAAVGAADASRSAQPQTAPMAAAAQAAAASLLATTPRSPSTAARSLRESPCAAVAHAAAAAGNGQHGSLQVRDGHFPSSSASAAASAAAAALRVAEPHGVSTSTQATSGGVSDQLTAAVQMLHTTGDQHSPAHGGTIADQGAAAPHPMRFAEQLQRGTGDARATPVAGAAFGHATSGVHEAAAALAPVATAALPAVQARGGCTSAFIVSGAASPVRSVPTSSEHVMHAASAAAAAAPAQVSQQPNGAGQSVVAEGAAAPSEGGEAATHGHWLLALQVSEDTIRTWYSYARDQLKIADPLHEAHRGDFMKFMSDLQTSMAIHQYMSQARSQPQHGAAAAPAPVMGHMVAHAAPSWPGAAAGTQAQAQAPHIPHWGFRPH